MSRHPEVKWAQRLDKVYITVSLPDAKNVKTNLDPEGIFTFSANAGTDGNPYELKLDLFGKVNAEESKINVGVRNIFCIVEKAEEGWWKKLLRGDEKTPHYLKVDWDKWVDEDEDDTAVAPDMDFGGMDFSKFGGMGGMGGMEGLGGMGGMGGMEGLGGMGGLGGMEGLGGMGGLGGMEGLGGMGGLGEMGGLGGMGGGMGDELDDSDDEEEQEQGAQKTETAAPGAKVVTEGAAPST